MARKRKRGKNRRGFVAIPFSGSLSLATLVDESVLITSLFGSNFGEDIFVISIDSLWAIRDLTSGETPIEVGFAHGDLQVSELIATLVVELTDPDDIIAREVARRPVRRAGVFGASGTDLVLNDGKHIRTTMKISIGDGHNVSVWAANRSGATLTTGAIVEFSGTLYGRWQR